MARKKKSNYTNALMTAAVGALGVVTARAVSGVVGGGTTASAVKLIGGIGIATTVKGANATAFGSGMALDGAVDFISPYVAPLINSAIPSTLALRGLPTSILPTNQGINKRRYA